MNDRLIIAILLFIGILAGRLTYDLHLYFSGKQNRHVIGPLATAGALAGCSILAGWLSTPMWFFGFWAAFDAMYGLFIGQGLLYVGDTSNLDRLQHRFPALKILKFVLAIILILIFILL
jgi:hypothetical protein